MASAFVLCLFTGGLLLYAVCEAAPPAHNARKDTGYIDYIPGTLNVILAAPHGGNLGPSEIPDRDAGCWVDNACVWSHDCGSKDFDRCSATTVTDMYTWQLTELLSEELFTETGEYPHVVINMLLRRKLDANRDIDEAAFNVPIAMEAWEEFHHYINQSKLDIGGRGLFFDMHGHGHPEQWAELGYLISGSYLDSGNFQPEDTSIRNLAASVPGPFEEVLRGDRSFGHLLQENDFDAVPSPVYPGPDGASYFSGGYNTRAHGSRNQGVIDAIQIESARSFREEELRPIYAKALARSITDYLEMHYGFKKRPVKDNLNDNGVGRGHVSPLALGLTVIPIISVLLKG